MRPVLFIGPLPPPVTGRTVTTAEVLRRFHDRDLPVKVVSIAHSTTAYAFKRVVKAGRFLQAFIAILVSRRRAGWVYITVDADIGMYFTAICALLARALGLNMLLHHHNYSYLARKTFRMSLLTLLAGRGAFHINVCQVMADEMRSRYLRVQNTLVLSNVISVPAMGPVRRPKTGPLVLGHLSNLTFEKGIATVIACLRLLRNEGVDARLIVAGPPGDERTARLLREASLEFQGAFEHLGPLYGDQKQAFYERIDVFLFPSRYRNETQGIVNLEAMSAGVPVIAYGQCCIPSDLEQGGGVAVPPKVAFEEAAMLWLLHWASNRDVLRCASIAARRRFRQLRKEGEAQISQLLRIVVA